MNSMHDQSKSQTGGDQISVGNISNSSAVAIGRGSSASVTQSGSDASALAKEFAKIYQFIDNRDNDSKVDMQEIVQTVKSIEREATSNEPNTASIRPRLEFLKVIAPDVAKFVLKTLPAILV